jgi:hypothetical protein
MPPRARASISTVVEAAPPLADLVDGLHRLKPGTIRRQAGEVLTAAKIQRSDLEEILRTLVNDEIAARDVSNQDNQLKAASFPVTKSSQHRCGRPEPAHLRMLTAVFISSYGIASAVAS